MEPFLIPLKFKYRTRKSSTGGAYKARAGNCYQPTPKYPKNAQGTGHRRKQGIGATG